MTPTHPPPADPRPPRSGPSAWGPFGARPLRVLALLLGLGGGLRAEPLQHVTLQLKWQHQFQFAGYYAAQEKGFYREAGLDVTLLEADPATEPVMEVIQGRAQYGVSNSALLLARQQGQPVLVLAVIFQHSPLVLVARSDSGIASIHDLVGRRVMLERQAAELLAYLKMEGVPLQGLMLQTHTFEAKDLVHGKVDALSAYTTDEPYFLEQERFPFQTFTPRTGGIDFYGDNLFTTEGELRSHPARVKAFREASLKGWKYAMRHPEEMADLILSHYGRRHDRAHLLFEARQMIPLLQTELVETGYMHVGRWQHIADTYAEVGLLPRTFSLDGFLYDPDAAETLSRRRMKVALTLVLPIAAGLGALTLVFLVLIRRLKRSNRAQAELGRTLEDSEQRFRFIAEHTADVIWMMDIATETFTYISPSVFQLRGYTPEEILSQPASAALTPESAERVRAELEASILAWRSGGPLVPRITEVEQPHKDGHLVQTEVVTTLHTDPDGRLASVLGVTRDITKRKRAELKLRQDLESMEQLAGTDLLTSAWNRRHFENVVEGEMHRATRYGQPLSLLMLDIDHFKRVNDTCGHARGDQVLREVADCVRTAIRMSDSLTRWGGEEFIVLMPNTTPASATILAERIREDIAAHVFEGVGQVTVSIGLAEYLPTASRQAWVDRADRAMYQAKRGGRNQVLADPARGFPPEDAEPSEGAFLKLVWSEAYCSGHPLIDAQHRHLFHLANELLDAVLSGHAQDEISMFVAGLLSEVAQHFSDEESILAELGYAGLEGHRTKHAELVARALEMGRDFQAGVLTTGSLFQFLAHDIVASHMLKADRDFFPLTKGR